MAEIVLGVGASHSPLLAIKPEQWPLRAEDDRRNPRHFFRGRTHTFDQLVELRRGEELGRELTLEVRRERDRRNQAHIDLLGRRIRDAKLDVLVIFGDDQAEIMLSDNMPAFMVFAGEQIPFMTTSAERLAAMTPAIRLADWARHPEHDMMLRGAPQLGRHVVSRVVQEGFDVAISDKVVPRPGGEKGIGHAFGFFWHRMLDDLKGLPDMATLPVFINTFFPPNQPTAKRVLEFGRAVGRAIRSWEGPQRVGIAASGGFSHFVIDEPLDRRLMEAIARRDEATLVGEPESTYQSGTSEIKNWIAAMGATEGTGLEFSLVDYIPCYRSEAGTGNAMAFALWA